MKKLIQGILITLLVAGMVSPALHPAYGQEPQPFPTNEATTNPGSPATGEVIEAPAVTADTSQIYLPLMMTTISQSGGGWTPGGSGWPTVAATPQRTSWTADQASGNLRVVWYRPIEAYISQNVQLIAANNLILVATARGLYALNPPNGQTVWRWDTQMPLGNSPTVVDGVVYVGGHDRKLHALNANNGAYLWNYSGAGSGYDTNPLVVDGRVFLGNRDGYMYAIGAHGTSRQGQLLWRFKTQGAIHFSAAYSNGIVYFASNDNYAYALNASSGALVWKSQKLLGDGFHSYWPVVYQDKVIFASSNGYRSGNEPGTRSVEAADGSPHDSYNRMMRLDLFTTEPSTAVIGPSSAAQPWSRGYPVINASRVTQYLESKPWRRTTQVLNASNGSEYSFDSDGDGKPEFIPQTYFGTNSGNRIPPLVGPDGLLYMNSIYDNNSDPKGRVMGWAPGTQQYVSLIGAQGALAEPQALSGGGSLIYRTICCDRVGSYININAGGNNQRDLWSYSLHRDAPGYDEMWTIFSGLPRLHGFYKGVGNSVNGIYHNHGDQNPLIPYGNMAFIHRSNAIIAYGTGAALGKVAALRIQSPSSPPVDPIGETTLRTRLEEEITKIIQAGHLRPGYYNHGTFMYKEMADYFENPGDTLYTLSIAYPYLSATLQGQVRTFLQNEFSTYFDQGMYSKIGWAEGAARESMPLPPEVQASLVNYPKNLNPGAWSWPYPPQNFYALWKYALIFPTQAGRAYDLAKSELVVPIPQLASTEYLRSRPFELNAYIAGYIGFLNLQAVAGRTTQDAALRTQVTNELNRLYQLRVSIFSKDTPYMDDGYHKRSLNIARNFIYLVPELGDYLYQADQTRWRTAIQEYEYVAPYWFVSRYEAMVNEGTMSPLYNAPAMFQAKAYILKESRAELTRYLDAPAFERGDLFYIQNLVAALQAQ